MYEDFSTRHFKRSQRVNPGAATGPFLFGCRTRRMDKDDLKRFDELTDDCIKKHKAFVKISKRATG